MTTFKSKAEERRAEWLLRQYAADQASTVQPSYPQLTEDELTRWKDRAAALAAAEKAVVKAAMEWWNTSQKVVYTTDDLYPMCAACAALAKVKNGA